MKSKRFEWKNASEVSFLCAFTVSLFWIGFACADLLSSGQGKNLPSYYVGHWTSAAIRSGDFSYFLRCDGTGEARWNDGKKEKFQDISYRVLSVSEDNKTLLFVKTVDTHEDCSFVCKKDAKCTTLCVQPSYLYWLLSPSDVYGPGYKMMQLEEFGWDSRHPPFANIQNPYKESDVWLKKFFEKNGLDSSSTSGYHYRGLLPCTHE
jgi:hypothetical protein